MEVSSAVSKGQFATGADSSVLNFSTGTGYDFPRIDTERGELKSVASESVEAVFLGGFPDWSQPERIQLIYADQLGPHPLNPRRFTSRDALASLAESIRESGVRKPLDICQLDAETPNRALILSGHRRFWTSNALQCELIPCRLDPRGLLTEVEQREALIRYNEGLEKPAPINRAQSVLAFMVVSEFTHKKTAARLGMTPASVSRLLKLLTLEKPVQEMVNNGELTEAVGFELARIKDNPVRQLDLALEAKEKKYSAQKVRRLAGKPKVKLGTRSNRTPQKTSQRTIVVGDSNTRITLSSNKVAISDEAIKRAVDELVGRIPVNLTVTAEDDKNSLSAQSSKPAGDDLKQETSSLESPAEGNTGTTSVADINGISGDGPSKGEHSGSTNEIDLPATSDDPFGLLQPNNYEFPVVQGHVSAAASSIEAVFTDGFPDWSRCDQIQLVFRSALVPHPWNPRKTVSTEAMRDTVLTVKQSGIHTPLDISQHPEDPQKGLILGGHRRTWCSHKLSLDLLPVKLDPRGILSEVQVRERLLDDNEGQEKPAPIDRARSFREFLDAAQITVTEAAHRVNVSEKVFMKAIRLLELPQQVQSMINNGDISESAGTALLAHRGGEQEVVALAHKVLANNIPLGTLQRMVRRSQVSLDGLEVGIDKPINETHHLVDGNNRIHVVISSDNGTLPEGEALAAVLRTGLKILGTAEDSFTKEAVPVEQADLQVESVLVSSLAIKNPQVFVAGILKYLPDFVQTRSDSVYVPADIARAMELRFTNDELKKLGVTNEDITRLCVDRWHGVNMILKKDDRVSIGEVMEYFIGSLHSLQSMPASKTTIIAREVEDLFLDTAHYDGGKRATIEQELIGRLKKAADIFEVRLLPLVKLDRIADSAKAVEDADHKYSMEELVAAGVTIPSAFNYYYRDWLVDTRRIEYTGKIEDRGLRFDDLHAYFTHCARELLSLTGGRAERNIGKKQLREANIVFSEAVGANAPLRHNSQSVFAEIRDSLQNLNMLFSSHTNS